jgi:Ca-activated chloride channel homolog
MEYGTPLLSLIGLVGLLAWTLGFWYVGRKAQIFIPGKYRLQKNLWVRFALFILGIIAWSLLSYSLASPRRPLGFTEDPIEVNDIFFVVDISRSMSADDLQPNRVEAAKQKILDFIKLHSTDRIGIVIFSERPYTLLPLSTDLKLVEQIVGEIKMGLLGSGTNIGDAVGLALARAAQSQTKNKIIILLTDGVSNIGTTTPIQAAQQAKEQKVKIYTIGIGSSENAKINLGSGSIKQYQNIPGGSFDFKTLSEMASLTGGRSYAAGDNHALQKVFSDIDKLERTKIERQAHAVYEEKFWPFMFWGIMLFFIVELLRRFGMREVV